MFDEEERDYGFDLPDTRVIFQKGEKTITIVIVRNWMFDEEMEQSDYSCSWDVREDGKTMFHIPENDQMKAEGVAKAYYGKGLKLVKRNNSANDACLIFGDY